jgi:hypothetical protein
VKKIQPLWGEERTCGRCPTTLRSVRLSLRSIKMNDFMRTHSSAKAGCSKQLQGSRRSSAPSLDG